MARRGKTMCAALLLTVLVVGLGAAVTCVGQSASDPARERADTLYQEGEAAYSAAKYFQAIPSFEQALALYRAMGYPGYEAACLLYLGLCHYGLGSYREAIGYDEQALVVLKEIGDQARAGEAMALVNLGVCYHTLREYEKAIGYYDQALAVLREVGDRAGEGTTLGYLGTCHYALGDYQRAIGYHEQSLVVKRALEDRAGEMSSLIALGLCYDSLGDCRQAAFHWEDALLVSRELGDHVSRRGVRAASGTATGF
jgi:tetratricopeptide (TPR) repeat protein